jgi:molybdate transport system ATP-binding protein
LLMDELLSGLDEANHLRALRWLNETTRSRMPWILATHRLEDVPRSATHALVLEKGRVVYRGVLHKAPLQRWLTETRTVPALPASKRRRPASQPIVRLERACVYLNEQPVLEGLSFDVRPGDFWVIHGHNGSGKTTLLRTLYGDHGVASGGRIQRAGIVPGVPLQDFKEKVGIVAPHLQADHPQELTVAEVVQSGRHASIGLNDAPSGADRAAAKRAWACRPRLLLLDEPFSGVDSPTRLSLMAHLAAMVASGTAVVMATHHRSEWPTSITHELELSGGRAIHCGPVRSAAAPRSGSGGG